MKTKLALLTAVIASIILGAWWLSRVEDALPTPVGLAPDSVVVAPAPPPAQIAAPLPAVATPMPVELADAGLGEVEIEVFVEGARQVGIRVELEGPGGREGRPTDVMGIARFSLTEGPWRVTAPARPCSVRPPIPGATWREQEDAVARARSTPFEVQGPLTRVRVVLPQPHVFRARVVDETGEPVADADVEWETRALDEFWRPTRSDPAGGFVIRSCDERLLVSARKGVLRSIPRWLNARDRVDLVVQVWTRLRVKVGGPGGAAHVVVMHRGDRVALAVSGDWFDVPVGRLEVRARRLVRGRVQSGRGETTAIEGKESELELELNPSPPFSGRVVDAAAQPVPGVSLTVTEIDVNTLSVQPDGGSSWKVLGTARTTSDLAGEFSLWAPGLGSVDPLYVLRAGEPWRTTRQIMINVDDAPLSVEVELLPR